MREARRIASERFAKPGAFEGAWTSIEGVSIHGVVVLELVTLLDRNRIATSALAQHVRTGQADESALREVTARVLQSEKQLRLALGDVFRHAEVLPAGWNSGERSE